MHTHANARLTQRDRLRLVSQHLHYNRPLSELATEAGISLRCAYKWLAPDPRFKERCHPSHQYTRGLEDMTNASLQRGH
jgi:hypothetical protein